MSFNPITLNQPNGLLQSLYQGLDKQTSAQNHKALEQSQSVVPSSLNNLAEPDPSITKVQPVNEFSASTVAGNVLQFVASRLAKEAANGAGEEQLTRLFDQAIAGVQQGFAEAKEVLDALGGLSETIDQGVDSAFQQIERGLSQLRDHFLPTTTIDSSTSESPATTTPVEAAPATAPDLSGSQLTSHVQTASVLSQQDFSFKVTTRDGDVVTIQASALEAYQSFSGRAQAHHNGRQTLVAEESFEYYQHQQFQLAINGELDLEEQEAINGLLNDVFALANDFYEGDIATAFEKALSLNFDTSQLQSFALNLYSAEVRQATDTYQSVAGLPSKAAGLQPLAEYAEQLQQTYLKAAERFNQPVNLLQELLTKAEDLFADEGVLIPRLAEVSQKLLEPLTS
ncbi:DUF5610 domain-containing protein [Endozoicomonas sp. SM1973]|uniref:DUF5610 domain-containing protein n=1 Tax=Spartinivicinus marinus TaxID=2994442 RepID=A0A853HVW9_9GAMM|nr:DUF5610 domain-containing protein [Spartinivicinus marinus]MCX4029192.1 DUF5610 domain-containing protein [Spartinivicinus marinus]NYZ65900.1 DUF5610 domain-containing protein [Spartinivicinus marinus]